MWQERDYFFQAASFGSDENLAVIYDRTCRCDFSQPGFVLINLGKDCGSRQLRQQMVRLKEGLSRLHNQHRSQKLIYTSLGRFDQQVTTKPHRDGGPEQSLLMLGYEPSPVVSRLSLADYSKCAFDKGITPTEFLERYNPMFNEGRTALAPYTTPLNAFDNADYQILLLNNSNAAFVEGGKDWLGVLHTAEIVNPMPEAKRVVNSTMIASVPMSAEEVLPLSEQEEFVVTDLVRGALYK